MTVDVEEQRPAGHSCKTSSKQPSMGIMSRENSRGGFPLPSSIPQTVTINPTQRSWQCERPRTSHSRRINVTATRQGHCTLVEAPISSQRQTEIRMQTRTPATGAQRHPRSPDRWKGRQINQRGSCEAVTTGLQVTTTQPRQKIKRFAAADVRTQLNQYDFVVACDHRDVTRCSRTDAISSSTTSSPLSADVPRVSVEGRPRHVRVPRPRGHADNSVHIQYRIITTPTMCRRTNPRDIKLRE